MMIIVARVLLKANGRNASDYKDHSLASPPEIQ